MATSDEGVKVPFPKTLDEPLPGFGVKASKGKIEGFLGASAGGVEPVSF